MGVGSVLGVNDDLVETGLILIILCTHAIVNRVMPCIPVGRRFGQTGIFQRFCRDIFHGIIHDRIRSVRFNGNAVEMSVIRPVIASDGRVL